jgi:hypothetical protein
MKATSWRLTASLAFAFGAFAATQASAAITVSVVSTMPQLVTGEDALVQIKGATGAPTVTVGGKDVSSVFVKDAAGNYTGLVTGLAKGNNEVAATAGADKASLTLVDRGINDTLFAGPQQTPWVCEVESFGLAKATDASCASPTKTAYYYKNKMAQWKPFDQANRPGDIATTKIGTKEVPLIIRQEIGVINRGAYVITILHDPAAGPAPTATDRGGSAWNGKLAMSFGPGVGKGYHSGRNLGQWAVAQQYAEDPNTYFDTLINNGYALASSSISVFGTQPNDVLSAESSLKVKEHFIEAYGVPMFTISQGPSGGSMQQNLIANAYPGILDGIMPERLYTDEMTFLQPLYDCELLVNVFKQGTWTREQMNAVSGKYWGYCVSNGARYPTARIDGCDPVVYDAIDKDPALKAKGVRCTFQDNMVNVFGTDPKTGFARNPYDNRGVQYGLKALNDGVITMAQFIDINTRIGGHDVDGKIVAARQTGDELAIKAAYATGRVNEFTSMKDVVYMDVRTYADGDPFNRGDANVDVHDRYHSDIAKARMQKYTGGLGNYVQILTANGPADIINTKTSPRGVGMIEALNNLDKWLSAVVADTSTKSRAEKIVANRPKDVVDTCYAVQGGAIAGLVEKITDQARCKTIFPSSADARLVAGAPATNDVFMCQLKPVAAGDYKTAPTADQLAALQKIFPSGVCDYSKPGVGQDQKLVTWAVFKGDGTWAGI